MSSLSHRLDQLEAAVPDRTVVAHWSIGREPGILGYLASKQDHAERFGTGGEDCLTCREADARLTEEERADLRYVLDVVLGEEPGDPEATWEAAMARWAA